MTEPETKDPMLLCQGWCRPPKAEPDKHYPHHYVRTERHVGMALQIFACDLCRTERVYGCVEF